MAKNNKKTVAAIKHKEASRKNIPTAEYQSVMQKEEQSPIRVAYERRNRDLDPQLVWRGKDEQDWSDLVVQAPPLYIQEKLHPKVLIDDLLRRSEAGKKTGEEQVALFFCAEGRYFESGRKGGRENERGIEKRAAIFVGPEFGTVSRSDLVAAAREAGDQSFGG
jgi:hypothetical protein